jgi:hypothetical protein
MAPGRKEVTSRHRQVAPNAATTGWQLADRALRGRLCATNATGGGDLFDLSWANLVRRNSGVDRSHRVGKVAG